MEFNLGGYLIYAFITAVTPGPNNLLLLSYGKIYGLKNSGNIVLGIMFGFFILLCLAGYGVASIITKNVTLELILKIIGSLWMLYLGLLLLRLNIQGNKGSVSKIGFFYTFFSTIR